MRKSKIFVYDELMLGGKDAERYFRGQTYCFPVHTGTGFGLFTNRKGLVVMLENPMWKGCWGEIWAVYPRALERIHDRFLEKGMIETKLFLDGTDTITTWVAQLSRIKGAKLVQIDCYRKFRATR